SPVRNSAGVIIGASKIIQDITARKRNERLLAEQNSLLELIASGCAMEECLAEVTRAVTRLRPSVRASVVLADAERQRIVDAFAAEISPSFGQGLRDAPINAVATGTCGAAIYTGAPVACEDIANDQHWSQSWRDLCLAHGVRASYSAPIVGSNGLALGSLMLCFDTPRAPTEWELRIVQFGTHLASIVVERAHSDSALRESEAKFRALADNIPHLAWMAHPDGSIFWYNRRWYDYTGASPESQQGWGWQSVHDPDVLPAVTERWQHSLATGETFEMVFPLRGADGVFRPFLTRIISIKDEQGRIVRWFGANTDITAQRETEEALRASELKLQEANRQKDEFLGIASHELRTPLTSITGNVQLAARTLGRLTLEKPSDEADEAGRLTAETLARLRLLMERTDRQVGRLDRLVGDLLDVSRISAGKLDMRPEPCDLLDIVRETVEGQRAAWPGRALSIILPRRTHLPLVADADRIGQVVTNYVTNALKYSEPDRPVTVRVSAAKGQARVEVRDEGPGLTPEQQTQLFERFYRVPGIEQRSGSGVGLGLGLHICKTIIERHDGQVGVESAPGKGSVFWFSLPLAQE
ncbi:MAG TPA: ATP-binding protein, partial [Ktedonobacterales bacterium]|nr:ATP-binding protein [Ktedonobacterales bacterium]